MAVKGAGRRVEIGGEDRAELERIARAVSCARGPRTGEPPGARRSPIGGLSRRHGESAECLRSGAQATLLSSGPAHGTMLPGNRLALHAYTGHAEGGGPFRDFAEVDIEPSEVAAFVPEEQRRIARSGQSRLLQVALSGALPDIRRQHGSLTSMPGGGPPGMLAQER